MSNSDSIWSKNFIAVVTTNLLVFISLYLLISTLPIYVTNTLNGNEDMVGYVIGVYSIFALIARPICGYMLDNIGRKKVLALFLVCYLVSLLGYNYVTGFMLLIIIRSVQGFFWGFTSTGLGTIASDLVPQQKRGEGLGYYGLSSNLAMAIGPSIALIIMQNGDFITVCNVASFFVVIGLILLSTVRYKENIEKKPITKKGINIDDLIETKVIYLASIAAFIGVVYSSIISFIVIYGQKIGIENTGKFFLIYSIALVIVRPLAGKSFDKNGPIKSMTVGFIFIILCFLLLFFTKESILFNLSALCMGIGHGICAPSLTAMAINRVDETRRGAANATMLSAQDFGLGMGSIVLGTLSTKIGLSNMYLVCAFMMIIPFIIFFSKEAVVYNNIKSFEVESTSIDIL